MWDTWHLFLLDHLRSLHKNRPSDIPATINTRIVDTTGVSYYPYYLEPINSLPPQEIKKEVKCSEKDVYPRWEPHPIYSNVAVYHERPVKRAVVTRSIATSRAVESTPSIRAQSAPPIANMSSSSIGKGLH